MRGDTSECVADVVAAGAPAAARLAARAQDAESLADVQRLVSELRGLPGIRDAALHCAPGAADPTDPYESALPVAPGVRLALRVRPADENAWQHARPVVEELVLAARRTLTLACPRIPAEPVSGPPTRDATVVIDPRAGWAPVSGAFDQLLGPYRPGRPGALLDLVHPDDRPAAVRTFLDACAGGPPAGPVELRLRTAGGRWRTLAVAVRAVAGTPFVAYSAWEVAAAAPRAVSPAGSPASTDFVATVAHELRGPLSSVVAFAHLLGEPEAGPLTDDQRSYLDVVDRNASRLLRLIEDLLLLSRLESGTLPLRTAPVQVRDLVEAVIGDVIAGPAPDGVTVTHDVADGPALVCDEARVHQLLGNLLANAVRFTPDGGAVVVTARPAGDDWWVEVSDTGVGIPAGELPLVFSPFFRGSNTGRPGPPGSGLGLALGRAIAALHGGTIQLASTEGAGTTVTLTLPVRPRTTDGG